MVYCLVLKTSDVMARGLLLSLRVIWSGSGEKEIFPCGQDDSAVVKMTVLRFKLSS
jgi:hypothetical protein